MNKTTYIAFNGHDYHIDDTATGEIPVTLSEQIIERFKAAQLEWKAVQDQLATIHTAINDRHMTWH